MSRLRLGNKLTLTFSIMLALFALASAVLLGQLDTIDRNLDYFFNHPYQITYTAMDIRADLLQMRVLAKDFILSRDAMQADRLREDINNSEKKLLSNIQMLNNLYLGDKHEIDLLRGKYYTWRQIADEAIALGVKGRWDEAQTLSIKGATAAAADLFATLDSVQTVAKEKTVGFYNEANHAGQRSKLLLLLFVGVSILVSAALAVAMSRHILKPLRSMMDVIQRVDRGEEAVPVRGQEKRADELGALARAFNSMLEYLKTQRELQEMAWTLERQQTLEQFRITLMSIGDAVISTDTAGSIVNMNSVAEELTGWKLEDAKGLRIEDVFIIINSKTMGKAENPLYKVIKSGAVVGLANHTMLISRNGMKYHISDSAAPILDDDGKLTGVVLVFRDVTEEYQRLEEIKYMSYHDKLTGLYNRAFLEDEIKRLDSIQHKPISLIMVDINGLKLINDAFGHQMGDDYLIAAAGTLQKCCRPEDIVARWGGDEFVLMLPKATDADSQMVCARITEACQSIDGFPIKLSMALGCATIDGDCDDYQQLLKEAETNMYRHKLLERGSVRNAIVTSLAKSMDEKDFDTENHAISMVENCRETGLMLGVKDHIVDELALLARLHDIGKIAISELLLLKPGKLDNEEWIEMQKHVEIGYRIANSISELEHIAEGILYHHERWDGKGYPKGLAGEEIPYTARIISVADAYDAMTRGRPYKESISHEQAIEELRRCAGSQFDPVVVEAFVQAVEKNKSA